jgi:hypothetical protein
MRSWLLSLIPFVALWWAVELLVYAYTGEWPNAWALLAAFFFGIAWGSRRLM